MSRKINIIDFLVILLATFYIILPQYFSLEISANFPSFTASRIVLIFVFTVLIFYKKKLIISKSKLMKMIFILLTIIILVNLYHSSINPAESLKSIFSILLENILLIVVITSCVRDKQRVMLFLKYMVLTSGIITLFTLIEFFTGFNVFYLLTTTSREIYQASYSRLDMTRAEGPFGHAVYYGVYSSSIFPLSLYLYECTRKKKYLFVGLLNILGVLISGSRGQMVAITFLLVIFTLKRVRKIKKKYIYILFLSLIGISIIPILSPSLNNYILENFKSILNIFGFDIQLSSSYGINESGLYSRTIQLSGIKWLQENDALLFGLGRNAASSGLVSYYWQSSGWQIVESIDVGFIGWFLEYGIIGFLVFFLLFASILIFVMRRTEKNNSKNLFTPLKWFFIVYIINLLSSVGIDKLLWIIISITISLGIIESKKNFNLDVLDIPSKNI